MSLVSWGARLSLVDTQTEATSVPGVVLDRRGGCLFGRIFGPLSRKPGGPVLNCWVIDEVATEVPVVVLEVPALVADLNPEALLV